MMRQGTESPNKLYLKEYTCYSIDTIYLEDQSPTLFREIKFQGNRHYGGSQLPTFKIDQFSKTLYMFRWIFREQVYLDIFPFQSSQFCRVAMNQQPTFVEIVDKHIYIIGGRQIHILPIDLSSQVISKFKQTQQILSMHAAILEDGKFGLIVYSWDKKFVKKEFSSDGSRDGQWWSGLKNLINKKQQETGILKVVLPNIFGFVFFNDEEFCLINLTTMELIERSSTKLTGWKIHKPSKLSVKFVQNECTPSKQDDSLLISVANGKNIQFFILHIVYKHQAKEEFIKRSKQPLISQLGDSRSIDWERFALVPFFSFYIEDQLIDYDLLNQGFIYFCENPMGNKITVGNYVQYHNPILVSPILTLQNNIWKQFVIDSELKRTDTLTNDRLFIPNRYSPSMVLYSAGQPSVISLQPEMINPQKLICDWNRFFQFRNIITWKNQILLVRDSSISVLLDIDENQYKIERQDNNDNSNIWNVMNDSKSKISYDSNSIKQFVEYEAFKNQSNTLQEKSINKFISLLERQSLEEGYRFTLATKPQTFARQVLINRVKDIINYYASCVQGQQLQQDLQKLIAHYLMIFNRISQQSFLQVCSHGDDLITTLINKLFNQSHFPMDSTINIQHQSWKIIRYLFTGLIPLPLGQNQNILTKMLITNCHLGYEYAPFILFQLFYSKSEFPIHYSKTILQAYFYLPLQQAIILQYLHGFLLQQPIEFNAFTKWVNKSQISKQNASLIKATILKTGLFSIELKEMPMEEEEQLKVVSSLRNDHEYFAVKDLIKHLQSTTLSIQKYPKDTQLIDLDDKSLQQFFSKSLQFTAKPLENIVQGWSLFFKVYIRKAEKSFSNPKQLLIYLKKCQKGLNNFQQYSQKLYDYSLPEEEYLAHHLGNFMILGKLPTRNWLSLIKNFLEDQQSLSPVSQTNILFYHLSRCLERGQTEDIIERLKMLRKLFSLREMTEIVMKIKQLRDLYLKQKQQVRVFFGYSELNRFVKYDPHLFKRFPHRNAFVESNIV